MADRIQWHSIATAFIALLLTIGPSPREAAAMNEGRILDVARKLRDRVEAIDHLLRGLERAPQNQRLICRRLVPLIRHAGVNPDDLDPYLPWPLAASINQPGIHVGNVVATGEPITLRFEDLTLNVLIIGPPGLGKTSLVFSLVLGAQRATPPIGVLIADLRGDWEWLARDVPRAVLVHDSAWRWDPLRPFRNTPVSVADQDFATHFAQSFGLFYAGKSEIERRLAEYRGQCAAMQMDPTFPGFRDFLARVRTRPRSAEEERLARIRERCDTLLAIYGPDALGAQGSFAIEDLLAEGRCVVVRLTAEAAVCDFAVALTLQRLYRGREYALDPFHQAPVLIVLDEARSLLRARDARALDFVSATDLLWARMRALGCAVCALDQQPSALAGGLLATVHTRAAFATTGPELPYTSRILGLDAKQAEELQAFDRGEFALRLPSFRWPHVIRARSLPRPEGADR